MFISHARLIRVSGCGPLLPSWVFSVFILMSLQGIIPDFLTIIAANTLIIGSTFVMAYGLESFAGKTPKLRLYIIQIVLMMVSLVYFTYFFPNVPARIITISIIYIITLWCLRHSDTEIFLSSFKVRIGC